MYRYNYFKIVDGIHIFIYTFVVNIKKILFDSSKQGYLVILGSKKSSFIFINIYRYL